MRRIAWYAGLVLVAACGTSPTAPVLDEQEIEPVSAFSNEASFDARDNVCYGKIVEGIASTWPWARDHQSYPPSPGALALWVGLFMPEGTTVRDLQRSFCD